MRLPTVLNLEGPVIVFGGGSVGMRKVEYLLKFTDDVILISEDGDGVPSKVTWNKMQVTGDDIPELIPEDCVLVVAAFSDAALNHAIAEYCMAKHILVNVVDDPEYSNILFPAIAKAGDVNVAISTSGRCPFLARKIREEAESWVEERGRWLEVLAPIRDCVDGMDETCRILEIIYDDEEIASLVKAGNVTGAKKKAEEVFSVHR